MIYYARGRDALYPHAALGHVKGLHLQDFQSSICKHHILQSVARNALRACLISFDLNVFTVGFLFVYTENGHKLP